MTDLHAAIMNMTVDPKVIAELDGSPKGFYLLGYRHARHAAAELVSAKAECGAATERERFETWLDARRAAAPLQSPTLFEAYCAALSAPAVPQWQPIETAPKDGIDVLLSIPGRSPVVAAWFRGGWAPMDLNGLHLVAAPTHWMPLPAAPSAKEQPDG